MRAMDAFLPIRPATPCVRGAFIFQDVSDHLTGMNQRMNPPHRNRIDQLARPYFRFVKRMYEAGRMSHSEYRELCQH